MPTQSEPYRIVQSAAFQVDWDTGVAVGWLNPVVHPAQLEYFTHSVLPTMPFFGQPVPSAAVNIRHIRFPRAPGSLDAIEITYSVVEDDRTVILERIHLVT